MYYYLYRFYDPGAQRWMNRDPAGEEACVNLSCFVFNSPLDLADAFGLDPGDKFPTAEAAAKDACKFIYPKTKKDGNEYGGWVKTTDDNKFTYDDPKKGDKSSVNMGSKPPDAAAMFHSHSSGENFSAAKGGGITGWVSRQMQQGDTFVADDVKVPSYLVTPSGTILRYDPDPKKQGNGPITKIGRIQN
jgi:hypothetical protein